MLSCRGGERAEKPFVPNDLGMPLHAQHKPSVRILDCFGEAVLGASGDCELSGIGHTLVVETPDREVVARKAVEGDLKKSTRDTEAVLSLIYQLVFDAIGYEGPYEHYGVDGWTHRRYPPGSTESFGVAT